jgi:S-formylglutathione hydrolase FrmB
MAPHSGHFATSRFSYWAPPPGVHSFRVWQRNLAAFAPLLFCEQK